MVVVTVSVAVSLVAAGPFRGVVVSLHLRAPLSFFLPSSLSLSLFPNLSPHPPPPFSLSFPSSSSSLPPPVLHDTLPLKLTPPSLTHSLSHSPLPYLPASPPVCLVCFPHFLSRKTARRSNALVCRRSELISKTSSRPSRVSSRC